ncbi:methyltransferase family protein [Anaerosphaera multitolerans]|uniref:Isoprenylcysteine carboxylmethyltransferase family protein n=1 Tax=Anaerosphaera multitolerans TaxID=2487351 RepID=A0A437S662_9FIRM|nr:isoprenylcysteine carboxylmethyltransferase family protein [Anaerosphaera multitolerans]RVU54489.1 isoprenylcysteine carboxylmethyltransferase family protein [Anaerosphaera multitolerans]
MSKTKLQLILNMAVKFGLGFLIIGFLLFSTAGTVKYINAWIYISSMAVLMLFFGIYLLVKEPETLKRRLLSREPNKEQRVNIILSALFFILTFILAGLDFRFKWSTPSVKLVIISLVLMIVGYVIYTIVILQNTYASRIVKVVEDQKLISEGIYSLVRHPLYFSTLLIFIPTPLILGSWYALIPMVFYPIIIIKRIKEEENLLIKELKGYEEYTEKVKYRLIPFIW